jgi:excisionase family DNA binding protein
MQSDQDLQRPFLLTIPQAARRMGISRAMLYSLLARRKGPPVIRLGRSVRISVASLRAWIAEQEREEQTK